VVYERLPLGEVGSSSKIRTRDRLVERLSSKRYKDRLQVVGILPYVC